MFRKMMNLMLYKLRAEKLYWAIGYVVTSAIYMKNSLGRDVTYCNVATYDLFDSRCRAVWWNDIKVGESERKRLPMGNVISAYNYNIAPIMPEGSYNRILDAPIGDVYDKCIAQNRRDTKLVASKEAQQLANAGIPIMIISKKYVHVAMVCPNLEWDPGSGKMKFRKFDYSKGCFTGNVGENNDYMFMSDPRGFGAVDWKDHEILYVQFKLVNARSFEDPKTDY